MVRDIAFHAEGYVPILCYVPVREAAPLHNRDIDVVVPGNAEPQPGDLLGT